jgi:hypothetical protein
VTHNISSGFGATLEGSIQYPHSIPNPQDPL